MARRATCIKCGLSVLIPSDMTYPHPNVGGACSHGGSHEFSIEVESSSSASYRCLDCGLIAGHTYGEQPGPYDFGSCRGGRGHRWVYMGKDDDMPLTRGALSFGAKMVWRCTKCDVEIITMENQPDPQTGGPCPRSYGASGDNDHNWVLVRQF